MNRIARIKAWEEILLAAAEKGPEYIVEARRQLGRKDLFFLLVVLLKRRDLNRDFFYRRCVEVQASPNGHLDLWAREHGKSSIITFGLTIQDILNDPEVTFGIFSFNRPTAKAFLRQIKLELETNEELKALYPDVLYEFPGVQSPKWSEDEGIVVRRKSNPKESTVEAWGLVDGQPTSKHFKVRLYDDMVTLDSVTTPEMILKVTNAWENSLNLGTEDGKERYIGTRWHFNDTYREIMKRGTVKARIHRITKDGTANGVPVLWSPELVAKKRRDQGPYVFGCQMLQNPTADSTQGFKREWLRYYPRGIEGAAMNKYLLVDPASKKKKTSDYTSMAVIGLANDGNMYLLDGIRDRLNLTERGDALFQLHKRWRPKGVGYEEYGLQADIEAMQERMGRDEYRFEITPLGGRTGKEDRIKRLVPWFEMGRFLLPDTLWKTNYEGMLVDIVDQFVEEEYSPFPVPVHDDFFDCMSRIEDPDFETVWPKAKVEETDRYARKPARKTGSAWAA